MQAGLSWSRRCWWTTDRQRVKVRLGVCGAAANYFGYIISEVGEQQCGEI